MLIRIHKSLLVQLGPAVPRPLQLCFREGKQSFHQDHFSKIKIVNHLGDVSANMHGGASWPSPEHEAWRPWDLI